jgi:M6 family metalloprotease-like protein
MGPRWFLSVILVLALFLAHLQPASAIQQKKPNWLFGCPEVVDTTPQLPSPKTIFLRSPSGQPFQLLAKDSVEFVTEPQSIIGCYIFEDYLINSNTSPAWQIGVINRDTAGYYFKNQAGVTWRLSYNSESSVLETAPGTLYYTPGGGFTLDRTPSREVDCKAKDFFLGYTRIGFPRNPSRLPQLGTTKNLILVVDFPDANLTEELNSIVDDVVAPRIVESFFIHSSNGEFRPTFDVFPKVIRLNSLEKSFAPNSSGGFLVNGIMQDHRLVQEAINLAKSQESLDGYTSLNVFAPTAKSMGYYGSAFMGLQINLGSKTIINSQLVGGTIGTVRSYVPSWKVFAHEFGHLLGMYDYYIHGSNGSTGNSPGPFDLMGNTSGGASTFIGFQRWVQNWLKDSDVICDIEPKSSIVQKISPLNNLSGKRLYVHPLDGTTVLVVELRVESEFDKLSGNDGLLVYLIDMKVSSGKGSVLIQPSEQDLVINPRNDVEKYLRAPLSSGQFARVKDLVIVAEVVTKDNASFRVFTSLEFQAKLEAEAKAAAELKAKQEAEAKAAAELKAKQEAEAKAAAEVKAKQEAEAKAAAEVKAKQEAEAKAKAAKKKITITCVKGKTVKKVTAVKPKCSKGYKVKK